MQRIRLPLPPSSTVPTAWPGQEYGLRNRCLFRGTWVAFNQFVNAGTKLKLESETAQRFVITGRASGNVIEAIVGPGQSFTLSANSESLRVDAFEAELEGNELGGIPFHLTQV